MQVAKAVVLTHVDGAESNILDLEQQIQQQWPQQLQHSNSISPAHSRASSQSHSRKSSVVRIIITERDLKGGLHSRQPSITEREIKNGSGGSSGNNSRHTSFGEQDLEAGNQRPETTGIAPSSTPMAGPNISVVTATHAVATQNGTDGTTMPIANQFMNYRTDTNGTATPTAPSNAALDSIVTEVSSDKLIVGVDFGTTYSG